MAAGFVVMFATGGLLFWALAAKCYTNIYFQVKAAALALAGLPARP